MPLLEQDVDHGPVERQAALLHDDDIVQGEDHLLDGRSRRTGLPRESRRPAACSPHHRKTRVGRAPYSSRDQVERRRQRRHPDLFRSARRLRFQTGWQERGQAHEALVHVDENDQRPDPGRVAEPAVFIKHDAF